MLMLMSGPLEVTSEMANHCTHSQDSFSFSVICMPKRNLLVAKDHEHTYPGLLHSSSPHCFPTPTQIVKLAQEPKANGKGRVAVLQDRSLWTC